MINSSLQLVPQILKLLVKWSSFNEDNTQWYTTYCDWNSWTCFWLKNDNFFFFLTLPAKLMSQVTLPNCLHWWLLFKPSRISVWQNYSSVGLHWRARTKTAILSFIMQWNQLWTLLRLDNLNTYFFFFFCCLLGFNTLNIDISSK